MITTKFDSLTRSKYNNSYRSKGKVDVLNLSQIRNKIVCSTSKMLFCVSYFFIAATSSQFFPQAISAS